MKTNIIAFFLTILIWHGAYSQQINFEQDSLEAVLVKAKQLGKPVFIHVSGPEISRDVPKKMREQMAGSGMDHPEVTAAYNSQFINFKAPYRSTAGLRLSTRYNIRAFPTFLYLSPEGILIHRNHGTIQPRSVTSTISKPFRTNKTAHITWLISVRSLKRAGEMLIL